MVRNISLLILLALAAQWARAANRVDSVYKLLDKAIAEAQTYVDRREARIDSHRLLLAKEKKPQGRYALEFRLYEEYKALSNDSAIAYLERATATATFMGDGAARARCLALEAFQCSTSGMYMESYNLLESIDRAALDSTGLVLYYHACSHLYGELGYYCAVTGLKERYLAKSRLYVDSLLSVTDESCPLHLQYMEHRMYEAGDYYGALRYSDKWMKLRGHVPTEFAIIAFYRYLDYKMLGNVQECTYWVAMSALADVRNGTTDQASMWELANYLYTVGDNKRAYRYIDFARECTEKFHTTLRSNQILPVLSNISSNYQKDIAATNRLLCIAIALVGLFALAVLAFVVYLYKQRKRLAKARNELSRKNSQLAELNAGLKEALADLDKSNRQLTATGQRLNDAIASLDESNRVKEKYIGLFLRQCSQYIDKMDAMRKDALALLKNKRHGELYERLKQHGFRDKEHEELFEIFDATFIRLFPTFVDELNSLLKPECRIHIADPSKLNTDIRIFALIRLGIDDSSKIAEFLHYSVNTIYNYRARIKNGAVCDRDTFEEHVKEIGLLKSVGEGGMKDGELP